MKFKLALSTATALGLLMGGALAGSNNTSILLQKGTGNNAVVTQDGSDNHAGRDAYDDQLRQLGATNATEGHNNDLSITQRGNQNRVGTNNTTSVTQRIDGNKLTIDQTSFDVSRTGNGNRVWQVNQTGTAGRVAGIDSANEATITQRGTLDRDESTNTNRAAAHHLVDNLTQIHDGGTKNTATILQIGDGDQHIGNGRGNRVQSARQEGSGNTLDITQDGAGDAYASYHVGPSNNIRSATQTGDRNNAILKQDGYLNGRVGSSGYPNDAYAFTGNAALVGVNHSAATQTGDDNLIQYSVEGQRNQFGFSQTGDDNQILGVHSIGSDNEIAIRQHGEGNIANFEQTGDDHNGAILAIGDDNLTDIIQIGGNKNSGYIDVFGDDNQIRLHQDGSSNIATATAIGSNNGGGSTLALKSINSDNNNQNTLVSGLLTTYGSASISAGLIRQNGSEHIATVNISGSNNLFAFLQTNGTLNTITSTIDGSNNRAIGAQNGSDNIAGITQNGSGNTTVFHQVGSGNTASFNQ